jgi:hypothetical protein
MCRFLMVRSETPFHPKDLLEEFAGMAEASRAPDGSRQGDGWGLAFRGRDGGWRSRRSLRPVWEDRETFASLPAGRAFAVHARSASFPDQASVLDYIQPFVLNGFAFVFNGLLKGVSFPVPIEGAIGSQKIWALLKARLGAGPAEEAIASVCREIEAHARAVQAMNIGLFDGDRIVVYGHETSEPSYYRLHAAVTDGLAAVCSEPLAGLPFRPLAAGTVAAL